jgi:hypothetical protein
MPQRLANNKAIATVLAPEKIITNVPAEMVSEDFAQLIDKKRPAMILF